MTLRRLLVSALHLCYIANVGHSFNIDMDFPILLQGPRNGNLNKHFGHSLQLYEKVCCIKSNKIKLLFTLKLAQNGQTKMIVGDPLNVNKNKEETGAVFECR